MIVLYVFGQIHERTVTRKSDNSVFKVRFQEAEIRRDGRRPRVLEISIRDGERYEEGLYTLSAQSFRVDKYDRLELGYPSLIPLEEALSIVEEARKARKTR